MRILKLILTLIIFSVASISTKAQTLIPELKSFEKIVNQKWIGEFDDPDEKYEIHLNIQTILNGVAILETMDIPEAENFSQQTLYYWDPEIKAIAATRITNNRWLYHFVVTPTDSGFLYEGTRYDPEGKIAKTKSERAIQADGSIKDNKGARDSRTFKRK